MPDGDCRKCAVLATCRKCGREVCGAAVVPAPLVDLSTPSKLGDESIIVCSDCIRDVLRARACDHQRANEERVKAQRCELRIAELEAENARLREALAPFAAAAGNAWFEDHYIEDDEGELVLSASHLWAASTALGKAGDRPVAPTEGEAGR